ncbi:MAG: ComF family protein [Lachnospiraceae bacterium]|nr:ComF family protein [Lachnospiraceae bacterium]
MNISKIKNQVEGLLYPSACIVCGEETKGELVCTYCTDKVLLIKEPKCMKCGKHIDDEYKEYCPDCLTASHLYRKGIGAFEYNEYLKETLYDLKYHGTKYVGRLMGKEIAKKYRHDILEWEADCIVPVPLHHKKERKRGYNQATIIAEAIGNELHIPVRDDILLRSVNTVPQKELSKEERIKNLENAFIIRENVVKLEKIIIVDDIYTTGATIDRCAKVLLESGCKEVYYIAVCIGVGV